jgi:hypothetical protein
MSFWADASLQAFGALTGTLAGGTITVLVARWQTKRTIETQETLVASGHQANLQLEELSRNRARSSEAARMLLERLADLDAWLPSLPDVSTDQPRLSVHARDQCRSALTSIRRGMGTDLISINDGELRTRYRELVRLAYDVGYREAGAPDYKRQIRDVRGYLRYVQHSLAALIDEQPLPAHTDPPVLTRSAGEPWLPPAVPPHWRDPADGS